MSRTRPTSLAELMDAPFRFVRREFRVLAPWAVLIGVSAAIPGLLNQVILSALGGMQGLSGNPAALMTWALLSQAAGLIGFALYFVGNFVLYTAVHRRLHGLELGVHEVLRGAIDSRLWIVTILEGMLNVVGLLLCGLPQLYLFPVLMPSLAIAMEEDVHTEAITRCFTLVHHAAADVRARATWGRAVALLHAVTFVTMSLTAVASAPIVVVMGVRTWRGLSDGTFTPEAMQDLALLPVWAQVPLSLLGGAATGLTLLYSVAARFHLYRDLVETREGTDLARALDAAEHAGG